MMLLLTACGSGGGEGDNTEMDAKTKMEIQKTDSIAQEIEKADAELKSETESVKGEVESLLEGI